MSSLIRPAPTSTTRRPASPSNTCCASAAAAAGTDAGLSPIAVSTRARRPACSAIRKIRSSSGPATPASNASRTWPRISPSPGTSESSPAATRNRWSAATRRRAGRRPGARASASAPASSSSARSARSTTLVVAGCEVELGAVAGREHDRLGASAAGCASSRASAPAPSRSTATRSRSSTGACGARPRRARASCREVGQGEHDGDEGEPGDEHHASRRPRTARLAAGAGPSAYSAQMTTVTVIAGSSLAVVEPRETDDDSGA